MAPKRPLRHLTHSERARIYALYYDAGLGYKQIAKQLGIPRTTVRRIVHSQIAPTKFPGRPPKLDTPTRRSLVNHATSSRTQRLKPLREIASELGITVSEKTLSKALAKERYYRRLATE